MASCGWTASIRTAVSSCICGPKDSESSDDEAAPQQSTSAGRQAFSRDELEGLLVSASSDEEGDAMSLHSNIGASGSRPKRKRGKRRDRWGMFSRNFSLHSRRSMQMFGWRPFDRQIQLESSEDEDQSDPSARSQRHLSISNSDTDASPLDNAEIAQLTRDREQERELLRRNFEPEITNEELEREERELAEQEEAEVPQEFAHPPSTSDPSRRAPPDLTHSSEPRLPGEPTPENASLSPISSPAEPPTPASVVSPTDSLSPSKVDSHERRLRKAARAQRKRIREEAERRAREHVENMADAAAGGFGETAEFGEWVQPDPAGVAWTETSDDLSSHPSSQPLEPYSLHHALITPETSVRPSVGVLSDEELSPTDYGAEYAHKATPRARLGRQDSVSRSSKRPGSEGHSSRGSVAGRRPAAVPLPPSTVGSGTRSSSPITQGMTRSITSSPTKAQQRPYKPARSKTHFSQTSMSSGQSGRSDVRAPALHDPSFDGMIGGLEEHTSPFDGVPGGLGSGGVYLNSPVQQVTEAFDGTPGGFGPAPVIPGRQQTVDTTTPRRMRSNSTMKSSTFPSTGLGSRSSQRRMTIEGSLNGAALARRGTDI